MLDKNGNEITDGCLLRMKFKMYNENCDFDGIFKVHLNGFTGLHCKLVELKYPEETFTTSLTWGRNDFCFDYKNSKTNPDYFKYLAIADKTELVGLYKQTRVPIRSYSNDIEIVG
jgi:hypothetical protein